MIEERVPPQNIEAEQAVLGAMLIDKEAIAKATEVLSVIFSFILLYIICYKAESFLFEQYQC